jgi:hypothetical protein
MAEESVQRQRRVAPHIAGAHKKPVEKRVGSLIAPGDLIEYGLTYQVNIERQLSVWLKTGVTSTVQAGEKSDEAWQRVKKFVDSRMEELIEEHTKGK